MESPTIHVRVNRPITRMEGKVTVDKSGVIHQHFDKFEYGEPSFEIVKVD